MFVEMHITAFIYDIQVWTWGKGDYFRLGHGTDAHIRRPALVEALKGRQIIHIAVGALHCLAATSDGQVFAWGDNDHGQQGNGCTAVNKRPNQTVGLPCAGGILRVAAGSSHSIAWTTAKAPSSSSPQHLPFEKSRDALGAHSLGLYEAEDAALKQNSLKPLKEIPSLAQQVLVLEPLGSRQHALSLLLSAAHILQSRAMIVEALRPHCVLSGETAFASPPTPEVEEEPPLEVAREGGGEAPAERHNLINVRILILSKYT